MVLSDCDLSEPPLGSIDASFARISAKDEAMMISPVYMCHVCRVRSKILLLLPIIVPMSGKSTFPHVLFMLLLVFYKSNWFKN
jgi:hypothetical protein